MATGKKNANGEGSIRQRSNGTWEARIVTGSDPKTGKLIRRSIYGKTKKEVRQKLTAALRALDTGTYQEPSRITVSQWMDEWLRTFCANTVKPLTLSTYKTLINIHIVSNIGTMELQHVRGVHIQRIYNKMIEQGLSPKTVKNVSAVMHKAFSTAIKQGYIAVNPCDSAELPQSRRTKIKPLTDSEIPLFLQAIENDDMKNAYALCLFAGLREGECLGLSWSQIDFNSGRIEINQQLQQGREKGQGYYIAPSPKNSKPRTIAPPPIAFDYLRAERLRQLENRMRAGSLWNNPDDLVFTNAIGQHLAFSTFYKHFKRIAAEIGRPDARPHDLRHTAATVAIASGADIKSVQDMLGHATASFTLNVYAHTSEQMMNDTAKRMQTYYDNIKKA